MLKQKFSGTWWLPQDPEREVGGTLTFPGDRQCTLDLLGSFSSDTLETTRRETGLLLTGDDFVNPGIILGISEKRGTPLTLFRCRQIRSTSGMRGVRSSAYGVNVILVGQHVESQTELLFRKFALPYDHLNSWASLSGFETHFTNDKEHHSKTCEVRYEHPEPPEAEVDDRWKYRIFANFNYNSGLKQIILKEWIYAEIEPPNPVSFDEALGALRPFQNLVSLGVGRAVLAMEGRATLAGDQEAGHGTIGPSVKVYFATPAIEEPEVKIQSRRMLFKFSDLQDQFSEYMRTWLSHSYALGPVLDLYFSTFYNPQQYLESRFLSLTQAIEAYHRRRLGGQYLPDKLLKPIKEELLGVIQKAKIEKEEGVPPGAKQALTARLKHINDYSLRRRVRELVRDPGNLLGRIIPKPRSFAEAVVNARNYLTHYSTEQEGQAESVKDLYLLAERLKALLDVVLLRELGFEDQKIEKLVKGNESYRHLKEPN